jgi:hypothetical protein
MGKAWEHSKLPCISEIGEDWIEKQSLSSALKVLKGGNGCTLNYHFKTSLQYKYGS